MATKISVGMKHLFITYLLTGVLTHCIKCQKFLFDLFCDGVLLINMYSLPVNLSDLS